jgi:hypothetical protein
MKHVRLILLAGFIAGTLDATAAVLFYARPINLHNAGRIFRWIASALIGKTAYLDSHIYPLLGLIIHYFIATSWATVYLLIFFKVFKPGYIFAKTILFATLIWITMNGFVKALAGIASKTDGPAITLSFAILLFCVSLPICLILEKKKEKLKTGSTAI